MALQLSGLLGQSVEGFLEFQEDPDPFPEELDYPLNAFTSRQAPESRACNTWPRIVQSRRSAPRPRQKRIQQ